MLSLRICEVNPIDYSYSLPNGKILDMSNFEEFADDSFKSGENGVVFLISRNHGGK